MSDTPHRTGSEAAAAMDDVLLAEAEARQALEACRRRAEALLEAAGEEARRVQRTANHRLSRLEGNCDRFIREHVAALREQASQDAFRTARDAIDKAALKEAVDRLATRLTRLDDG